MANKRPIAWHESCLVNIGHSLAKAEAELQRKQVEVERLRADARAYAAQIAEAKRQKLDGFDAERFFKKKPA